MFCPKCKAAYRAGFTRCSDCEVKLVERLPPPPEPAKERPESKEFLPGDHPVEIARFLNIHQADFAISVLEGSGIKAYLDQPFLGNMVPHYMIASGGIRLVVRAEDRERALEVLQSVKELNQDELADEEDES
jgi:hypothetical protein